MCGTVRPIEDTHPVLGGIMMDIANGRCNLAIHMGDVYRKVGGKYQVVRFKIKPNEPCPCGSGLKYKKCCG